MRRLISILIGIGLSLNFLTADAVFSADKDKEVKITGTVVAVPVDPAGQLAGIVIQCNDAQYYVAQNAIAKKIAKKVGKKLDITGAVEVKDGKNIIAPWTFQDAGAKPRPQPTG